MTKREAAAYALDALKKAGADKAACRVSIGRKDEFNAEAGAFSLMRTLFESGVSMKAIKDGRKGVTAINKLDKAAIDEAARACVAMTASAAPDEADDISPADAAVFTDGVLKPDMDALFGGAEAFMDGVKTLYPSIIMESFLAEYDTSDDIYMNTNGACFERTTGMYAYNSMFSAHEGDKASSFNGYAAYFDNFDTPLIDIGMNRTLLAEACVSVDTRMVEGKFVGPMIVTPACMGDILNAIAMCGLSDTALIQGTSRWKDALGQAVANRAFTLRAAPLDPRILSGERYTADGFRSADCDIIRDGVLQSFRLTQYGANKTGKPRAHNGSGAFIVEPGGVSFGDIVAGIDRGLLINRFSGGQPGPNGDFTGVAKNSFLIEHGRITDAVSETMISANVYDMLNSVVAVSREQVCDGMTVMPWCCFGGVTVSGK